QQTFYRLNGKGIPVEGKLLFKAPKTEKARRTVDLPTVLVSELRALRDEQSTIRNDFGPLYHDHGLVFCQMDGKPLHAHNIARRDFRRVLALKGLRAELLAKGAKEDALPK